MGQSAGLLILSLLILSSPRASYAFAGDLDRTFGREGIVSNSLGLNDSAEDLAIAPDGTIIAVGGLRERASGHGMPFFTVRYNANGLQDTRFGSRGSSRIEFAQVTNRAIFWTHSQATAVAIQRFGEGAGDYNVIVGGYSQTPSPDTSPENPRANLSFGLIRLNASGLKDSGFGPPVDESIRSLLATRSDVLRILEGTVVTDFDARDDGITDSDARDDGIMDLAIDTDGRIVAAGYSCNYDEARHIHTNCKIALARYDGNGILDVGFGRNGKVFLDLGWGDVVISKLAVLPNNKILIAGTTTYGARSPAENDDRPKDYLLARLNVDGSLDASFGESGWGVVAGNFGRYFRRPDGTCLYDVSIPSQDRFYSLAIRNTDPANPNILIAGQVDGKFAVASFDQNGRPDTGFGCSGKMTVDVGDSEAAVEGIAVQPNGKILLTGGANGDIVLVRLSRNGRPDTWFGDSGKIRTDVRTADHGGTEDSPHSIIMQGTDRVLVAGEVGWGSNNCSSLTEDACNFALVRYATAPDRSPFDPAIQGTYLDHLWESPRALQPQPEGGMEGRGGAGKEGMTKKAGPAYDKALEMIMPLEMLPMGMEILEPKSMEMIKPQVPFEMKIETKE